jgi:hypothetical protein
LKDPEPEDKIKEPHKTSIGQFFAFVKNLQFWFLKII